MCFILGLGVLGCGYHLWMAPAGLRESEEQREPHKTRGAAHLRGSGVHRGLQVLFQGTAGVTVG